jgi:hypothetical protein
MDVDHQKNVEYKTFNIVMNHMDIFQNHFKAVFPELFLLTATMIILLYAVLYNPLSKYNYPTMIQIVGNLSILTLGITLLLLSNNNH